ncbi:hypothetical protein Poli38472_001943 [Pythium oligandrum]|uniref:Uncharacterized protein n=1 Tax=Pythium oligandrum TaxID=41045 RepID=A0A8K1CTS3_PYTOL|nr:hypothetical protein Poli38472_001943 [Pythium oligandrum]|eukprot:TMW69787.1 hypothetical protein Poli38472_001943 [Pythium oligandrum]
MLSRLYDERVFTSSDDVVMSASSVQVARDSSKPWRSTQRHGQRLTPYDEEEEKSALSDSQSGDESDDDEAADDEHDDSFRFSGLKFPMQSPRHLAASQSLLHRQRRRVGENGGSVATQLKRRSPRSTALHSRDLNAVQLLDRPMELVFLPNGEIRARDECPVGLALPPPQSVSKTQTHRLMMSPSAHLDDSMASSIHITRQMTDPQAEQQQQQRQQSTPKRERREPHALRRQQAHADSKRLVPNLSSSSSDEDNQEENDDEDEEADRDEADEVNNDARDQRTTPQTVDRTARETPKHTHARRSPRVSPRREKGRPPLPRVRTTETEIRTAHGFSNNAVVQRVQDGAAETPVRHTKTKETRTLEQELQKEKKRVLEKMTQLLEEQGKNQALQQKLDEYHDKIATMEATTDQNIREVRAQLEQVIKMKNPGNEAMIKQMQSQMEAKDAHIKRLEKELDREKNGTSRDKAILASSRKDDTRLIRSKERESALAKQLEELMNRITTFHAEVERWKATSREALECCQDKNTLLEMMNHVWMDFPQFISKTKVKPENVELDQSNTIEFLTKRLRQKEDELRLTHVKYVELKELCARQCIREADLQNFINEHRLRGNLVIRNPLNDTAAGDQETKAVRRSSDAAKTANATRRSQTHSRSKFEIEMEEDDEDESNSDHASDSEQGSDEYNQDIIINPRHACEQNSGDGNNNNGCTFKCCPKTADGLNYVQSTNRKQCVTSPTISIVVCEI